MQTPHKMEAMPRALLLLALFSAAVIAQPTVAPTEVSPLAEGATASNNERTYGGYSVVQSFESGFRFHSVGGDADRYRSDVNLGNGLRLLGSALTVHSLEGHGRLFDEITLTTQGLGNDPYQSATMRIERNRLYRYDLNWRLNDYVNPGLYAPQGAHPLNTRRQWQDHDFVLLPHAAFQFLGGISRNTQSGPTLTTIQVFDSRGDEFPLFADIFRRQSEYRAGFQLNLSRFHWQVMRAWQPYEETTSALNTPQPSGFNASDNTTLANFARTEPYTGSTPSWRSNLTFEPISWFSVAGRFSYAGGRRAFRFDESLAGTDRFGSNRNRQTTITGNGTRPVASAGLTLTAAPSAILTISNQTAFHQIQMNGESSFSELNNGNQGARTVQFDYLGIRTIANTSEINVRPKKWFGFFGAYQYSNRRIRSAEAFALQGASPSGELAEQTNRLNATSGGVRFKPAAPVTIVIDGELGRANQPFLPVSEKNYHAFGGRAQYKTQTLLLSAAYRLNYNTNSASLTSFSSKSRNVTFDAAWTPLSRFSLDAGYGKLHLDTLGGLSYFANGDTVSGVSRYISNVHSIHLTARASLSSRVELFVGYNLMKDTGDGRANSIVAPDVTSLNLTPAQAFTFWQVFPLSFQSPQAKLSIALRPKLRWNLGYQHYKYSEKALGGQNYNARTGFTSLVWSF